MCRSERWSLMDFLWNSYCARWWSSKLRNYAEIVKSIKSLFEKDAGKERKGRTRPRSPKSRGLVGAIRWESGEHFPPFIADDEMGSINNGIKFEASSATKPSQTRAYSKPLREESKAVLSQSPSQRRRLEWWRRKWMKLCCQYHVLCCHSDCHFQGHQVSGIHRKICQRTQGHCVEVDERDGTAHVKSDRVPAFSFLCQFRGHKAEQNTMSFNGSSQQPMKTSPSLVASVRSRSGSLYKRQGDVWKQRASRSTHNLTAWSADIPERILMQLYDVHDVHAAPGWNVMARRPQARRNWNASNSRWLWLWVQFFLFNISKFASAICWIEKN